MCCLNVQLNPELTHLAGLLVLAVLARKHDLDSGSSESHTPPLGLKSARSSRRPFGQDIRTMSVRKVFKAHQKEAPTLSWKVFGEVKILVPQ